MRVLLLDLDDTVFDRGAAFRRWAAKHVPGAEVAWLEQADARGRRPRRAFADDVTARHPTLDAEQLAARFPAELAACVEPEPGVRALIAELARHTRVAIVTNGSSAAQREKLRRARLDDVVHEVFVSGELGIAKPDPEIFERAVRWSERAAGECVFVGDDPINDIAPAAALGMTTVWRTRDAWPVGMPPPDHTLASLERLAGIVA